MKSTLEELEKQININHKTLNELILHPITINRRPGPAIYLHRCLVSL